MLRYSEGLNGPQIVEKYQKDLRAKVSQLGELLKDHDGEFKRAILF